VVAIENERYKIDVSHKAIGWGINEVSEPMVAYAPVNGLDGFVGPTCGVVLIMSGERIAAVKSLPMARHSANSRHGDAFVINAYDVFDVLYPPQPGKNVYHWERADYAADGWDGHCALIMAYCAANNLHYYAAPKEDFFIWEAVQQADALKCYGVVVDNLS
jgi:hypothetical protein